MIIDHNKKFLFVCIPKTGSTSFRSLFGASLNCPPNIYHKNITEILLENPETSDYFKACFVRNPYSRIISAYQNLVSDKGHHDLHSDILSFNNFEDFIFNFEETPCRHFRHLQTQTSYTHKNGKLCMDFLGRFENIAKDFSTLKDKLKLNKCELPHHRRTDYFFDPNSINKNCKDKIYEVYKEDFINFNYEK